MPIVIGLTGGFGTGKSTVAAFFAQQGARIIDADRVVAKLLEEQKIIKKLVNSFGYGILTKGRVDRKTLATLVFKNPRLLRKLTNVLYPEAIVKIKQQIKSFKRAPYIVLDVPLLFEAGWDQLADTTVVVRSSQKQQIERIQKRMGLTKADILRRIRMQMPLKQKIARSDAVIDNKGSLTETRAQVAALIHRMSQRKQ